MNRFFPVCPKMDRSPHNFQMEIIDTYDELLEEIGETQINAMLQEFDPTLKLGGMVAMTTAGFWLFQNYVAEDKVKGAKLLKQFLSTKQSEIVDQVANASKKQKEENKKNDIPPKKKRRGPSFKADDINAL